MTVRDAPPVDGQFEDAYADDAPDERFSLARVLNTVARWLVLMLIVVGAVIALALVLTPPRESVLILGSDARPDEIAEGVIGRTDTLMLLVADRAEPLAATLSIPRDLWVTIAGGYGQERINAAYELGGPGAATQTVSSVVGQPVDHYLLIHLQGVRDVIDALGGVDITVETPIHDDAYPTDDYGIITIDIPAGPQHMDGTTALEYGRTRHQDSDFGRAERQQQVLAAVRAALVNPLNWWRLPAFTIAVSHAITTDLSPTDAIAISAALVRYDGAPASMVIDTQLARQVTGSDGAYLLQATPDLKPAVARFLHTSTPSIQVLNGAGVAGVARTTADRLTGQGYTVGQVGDADRPQSQTTLSARPASRSMAESIARSLGLPTSRVSTSAGLPAGVDVQVVVGTDLGSR
ncbi:MAG: LCP family protein [Chloroflexi bacterium]|nr:LCP family protein [Chloroflexota bacterium]